MNGFDILSTKVRRNNDRKSVITNGSKKIFLASIIFIHKDTHFIICTSE